MSSSLAVREVILLLLTVSFDNGPDRAYVLSWPKRAARRRWDGFLYPMMAGLRVVVGVNFSKIKCEVEIDVKKMIDSLTVLMSVFGAIPSSLIGFPY
jgi:hypothetical protein